MEPLFALARADLEEFFQSQPAFRGRCLAIVLAQGAAQHLVYGRVGVKDLDVDPKRLDEISSGQG